MPRRRLTAAWESGSTIELRPLRFREAVPPFRGVSGSVLVPMLLAFAVGLNDLKSIASLEELVAGPLAHCTLQLWLPDEESEKHIYLNDAVHGAALADV